MEFKTYDNTILKEGKNIDGLDIAIRDYILLLVGLI